MTILIIHEVSYLKKIVYEFQDMAERLAARGHTVRVIDFDGAERDAAPRDVSRTGLAPVRLEHTPHNGLPLLHILSARRRFARRLRRLCEAGEVDAILLYSVFVNGTNAVRIARRYGIPVVYRVLDIYHRVRRAPLLTLPLWLGERFIYRNATRVLALNRRLADYVRRTAGRRSAPVTVAGHGVDIPFFYRRRPSRPLARRLGLTPQDAVVLFLGTAYDFCGLDLLVEQLPLLSGRCPAVKLLVVGDGELVPRLYARADALDAKDRLIVTGFVPFDTVPDYLRLAHVAVTPFRLTPVTRHIIPTKVVQYLAAGLANLCAPLPDVMATYPAAVSGIRYADMETGDAFSRALIDLLTSPGERRRAARRGRAFCRKSCSADVQVKAFETYLQQPHDTKEKPSWH